MSPSPLRISVIITAYNYRQFIAETIDSALAQTHLPMEVLVIDDGSSDGTAAFVSERYAQQPLVRVCSYENRGQLAAFITGAKLAQGDLLAFLDADDLWQPQYLQRIAEIYTARPEIDFVYTNMRFFGTKQGAFLTDTQSRDLGMSILLGAYSAQWQGSATSAVSLRSKLAKSLLDIPDSFLPKWKTRADDWLVYGSDVLGGRKYYLAETLVDYRAHEQNAWLDQQNYGVSNLRHCLEMEILLAHYRQRAGLSGDVKSSVLRHAKHEFRTKPQPTFNELQLYVRLLSFSSWSWGKRMEHAASMWRHYLKTRRAKKH